MVTNRQVLLTNDHFYHIFNRGINRQPVFTTKKEYERTQDTLEYYRFASLPVRQSKFLVLPEKERALLWENISSRNSTLVDILAYCLLPNHFHFLLRQNKNDGISRFLSNFTNSYTKYFNTKHKRTGPLFTGTFKSVLVESDEQLIHLSRYIHLNPTTSFLVKPEVLKEYPWSSYSCYFEKENNNVIETETILSYFKSKKKYEEFVMDQASYARELELIKHVSLDMES